MNNIKNSYVVDAESGRQSGHAPSFRKKIADCRYVLQPKFCFSLCRPMEWSPVASLLLSGCPSAIPRFVVPVIVDPVKALLQRTMTHISEKSEKGVFPTSTDADASTSVANIGCVLWVVTSLIHALPCFVCASIPESVPNPTATATRRFPGKEICGKLGRFCPTRTNTKPPGMSITAIVDAFDYFQIPESAVADSDALHTWSIAY